MKKKTLGSEIKIGKSLFILTNEHANEFVVWRLIRKRHALIGPAKNYDGAMRLIVEELVRK